jgi:hypothetical protein
MNNARAPQRFRARYIRVTPKLGNTPEVIRVDITGLGFPPPTTVDEEIAMGKAVATFIEVALNAAFVIHAKQKKVEKSATSC